MKNKLELKKEFKDKAINDIKNYFLTERDENIGDLASILLLDFITEKIGPIFYNMGIIDSAKYISEKIDDMPYLLEID